MWNQDNQSTERHDVLQHCPGTSSSEVALRWCWHCTGSASPSQHLHSPKHWGSPLHPVHLSQCLRTSKTGIMASGCLLQPKACVWPHMQLCHWESHFLSPPPACRVNPVCSCPVPVCRAGKRAAVRL